MKKLRILVGGYIGSYCTSGVTWDYIQYPLGLHLLGHDVYYIEDTLGYACHYDPDYKWDDPTPVVNYLEKTMNFFGLKDKWIYRDAISRKSFGIAESRFTEICANADVFINVSGSTYLRDEYLKIPSRVLIDSDPMFTQIPNSANKDMDFEGMGKLFSNYNNLFSFGENINGADCKIPTHGYNWKTTRQPVCLDYWIHNDENYSRKSFSTIMNLAARTN